MIDSSKYQSEFLVKAKNLGWPEDVIDQIKLEITEAGMDFNYPSSLEDIVFDLEYGKFEKPPKPAMRNFKASTGKEAANKVLEKTVTDVLRGSVFD